MRLILFSLDEAYEEFKAVKVDMWYDRSTRSWILTYRDQHDDQVGLAEYIGGGKAAALKVKKQMEESLDA